MIRRATHDWWPSQTVSEFLSWTQQCGTSELHQRMTKAKALELCAEGGEEWMEVKFAGRLQMMNEAHRIIGHAETQMAMDDASRMEKEPWFELSIEVRSRYRKEALEELERQFLAEY